MDAKTVLNLCISGMTLLGMTTRVLIFPSCESWAVHDLLHMYESHLSTKTHATGTYLSKHVRSVVAQKEFSFSCSFIGTTNFIAPA